jgi:hypothetical protein
MAGGLPLGYRFYPTEEELICFYLRNKLDGLRDDIERIIPVFEVNSVDPWQLTGAARSELTMHACIPSLTVRVVEARARVCIGPLY